MEYINAEIKGISYYLPEKILDNKELANLYENWSEEKILNKTGIARRHVADEGECASDLAVNAAKKLFDNYLIKPQDIDFVLLATESPDYIMPSTACVLQHRLGIPKTAGALDFNLGCSGYIYGLALAKGLIASKTARNILFITADTLTKYTHPYDKSFRMLVGDGATASWVAACEVEKIHSFYLGTDGEGAEKLIVPAGGCRLPKSAETGKEIADINGNIRSQDNLYMDGPGIFNFMVDVVPQTIKSVLDANELKESDINLYVFHQANKYMLDFLQKYLSIPGEKFYVNMYDVGNTISSSIPIALSMAEAEGRLCHGNKVMLVGFGVGLSWGAVIIEY